MARRRFVQLLKAFYVQLLKVFRESLGRSAAAAADLAFIHYSGSAVLVAVIAKSPRKNVRLTYKILVKAAEGHECFEFRSACGL